MSTIIDVASVDDKTKHLIETLLLQELNISLDNYTLLQTIKNKSALELQKHEARLKLEFGADLEEIFGPVCDRKPISSLTRARRKAILKSLPEKKSLSQSILPMSQVQFEFFEVLRDLCKEEKGLYGVDLGPTPSGSAIANVGQLPITMLQLNYNCQRGIHIQHIVRMAFNFDPKLASSLTGRFDAKRSTISVNDGQQRSMAQLLLGIRHLPIQFIVSSFKADDSRQFAAINSLALPTSDFVNYKNEVYSALCHDMADQDIPEEYECNWAAYNILKNAGYKFVEDKPKTPGSHDPENGYLRHAYSLSQIRKHMIDYAIEAPDGIGLPDYTVFERAVAIYSSVFGDKAMQHEPIWGLCELIKHFGDATGYELSLRDAMRNKFRDPKSSKSILPYRVWASVRNQAKASLGYTKDDKDHEWRKEAYDSFSHGKKIATCFIDILSHETGQEYMPIKNASGSTFADVVGGDTPFTFRP